MAENANIEMDVCQVCGDARPVTWIVSRAVDCSERFGLAGRVVYSVNFCVDRRVCRQGAMEEIERFKNTADALIQRTTDH